MSEFVLNGPSAQFQAQGRKILEISFEGEVTFIADDITDEDFEQFDRQWRPIVKAIVKLKQALDEKTS